MEIKMFTKGQEVYLFGPRGYKIKKVDEDVFFENDDVGANISLDGATMFAYDDQVRGLTEVRDEEVVLSHMIDILFDKEELQKKIEENKLEFKDLCDNLNGYHFRGNEFEVSTEKGVWTVKEQSSRVIISDEFELVLDDYHFQAVNIDRLCKGVYIDAGGQFFSQDLTHYGEFMALKLYKRLHAYRILNNVTLNGEYNVIMSQERLFDSEIPSGYFKYELKSFEFLGKKKFAGQEKCESGFMVTILSSVPLDNLKEIKSCVIKEGEPLLFKGNKEGEWREYWNNGKVKAINNYHNNIQKNIQTYYHPNGIMQMQCFMNEGKKMGGEIKWREDNSIKERNMYLDGEFHGQQLSYHNSGEAECVFNYYKGRKDGEQIVMDLKGNVVFVDNYKEGVRDGVYLLYNTDEDVILYQVYKNNVFKEGKEIFDVSKKNKGGVLKRSLLSMFIKEHCEKENLKGKQMKKSLKI